MVTHERFRDLLDDAKGESDIVIVVNVDIRGFSQFSLGVESVEAAIFIKKFYARLLSDFFADADFFKPTGDGMLFVFVVDEETLRSRSNRLVATSLRLVDQFPRLMADEPVINFAVPDAIGVGIARGAASRLVARSLTLDYSGKVLNLASRLMDRARPAGVVLDASFGVQLLEEDLASQFATDDIYVRSVAEDHPTTIYYTREHTNIPASAHKPLNQPEWHIQTHKLTFDELLTYDTSRWWYRLDELTDDPETIEVIFSHLDVSAEGAPRDDVRAHLPVEHHFQERAGRQRISVDANAITATLAERGLVADVDWPIEVEIIYTLV